MSEPTPKSPSRRRTPKKAEITARPWRITCSRCGSELVEGQRVEPTFPPSTLVWSEHPVLSKPPVIRGFIPTDGSKGVGDLSLAEQLRQRAAMGGEKERAQLKAFEEMWADLLANALVAQLREEAAAHGVDVLTWLARTTQEQEPLDAAIADDPQKPRE